MKFKQILALQGDRGGKSFLLALLAGALYAAGFPIKDLPVLGLPTFLGLGLLFGMLQGWLEGKEELGLRRLILIALGFSLGHYQLGFYWIPYTLREFGGLAPPINFLVGLFFSVVIVPQLWCFLAVISYLKKKNWARQHLVSNAAFLAATITLLENFIPQQFPAHAGHVWLAFPPLVKLAPYLGAPFYSFITYYTLIKIGQAKSGRARLYALAPALVLVTLSTLLLSFSWKEREAHDQLALKLVQPNVGNFMKIASEAGDDLAIGQVFERYHTLSLSGNKADLIIWPETAYPRLLQSESMMTQKDGSKSPALIQDIVNAAGADLLTGGYDLNVRGNLRTQFETEYNTAFLFKYSESAPALLHSRYHKMKLIPFGEGLPFGPLNPLLSQYITNISYFGIGEDYTLFEARKSSRFITPICYEILFDSFIRDYLNAHSERPHFILNLTNDSWYGITSEPYQHLFLAKWRAIEFQLPLVRMTNTGISSILYPDGSESERIGLDQAMAKDYILELKESTPTVFQRFGLGGVTLFMLIFIFIEWRLKDRAKNLL